MLFYLFGHEKTRRIKQLNEQGVNFVKIYGPKWTGFVCRRTGFIRRRTGFIRRADEASPPADKDSLPMDEASPPSDEDSLPTDEASPIGPCIFSFSFLPSQMFSFCLQQEFYHLNQH